MKRFKQWLYNWLLKDEIDSLEERLNKLEQNILNSLEEYEASKNLCNIARNNLNNSTKSLEDCRKTMNSICDVGVDIGFRSKDHSWAVICVHGKVDYVKFVPMGHNDVMDITRFLKRYEYSNKIIDSPFAYRGLINDLILNEQEIR